MKIPVKGSIVQSWEESIIYDSYESLFSELKFALYVYFASAVHSVIELRVKASRKDFGLPFQDYELGCGQEMAAVSFVYGLRFRH